MAIKETDDFYKALKQRSSLKKVIDDFFEKYQIAINPVYRLDILMKERTIDSRLLLNNIPIEISGGIETVYKRKIFVRLGFYPSGTVATGLGIFWGNMTVDYAYLIDQSITGIDNNHLITVSVSSDWIKKKVFN